MKDSWEESSARWWWTLVFWLEINPGVCLFLKIKFILLIGFVIDVRTVCDYVIGIGALELTYQKIWVVQRQEPLRIARYIIKVRRLLIHGRNLGLTLLNQRLWKLNRTKNSSSVTQLLRTHKNFMIFW